MCTFFKETERVTKSTDTITNCDDTTTTQIKHRTHPNTYKHSEIRERDREGDDIKQVE